MRITQEAVLATMRNAHKYLTDNPPTNAQGGTPEGFGPLMQDLDALIARVGGYGADQTTGKRLGKQETRRQRDMRRQLLRDHMRPIAKVTRRVLRNAPGIEAALYAPQDKIRTQEFLNAAEAMARSAEPYRETFQRYGRPADFIERLRAGAQTFERSLTERNGLRGQRATATSTLPEDIRNGRLTVEMLDDVVRPYYRQMTNEELLNGWNDARKIRKISVSGSAPDTPSPTPVPALPAGSTTPHAA